MRSCGQHEHLPGSVSPVYQPLWPITNTAAPGRGGTLLPFQATGRKAECSLGHGAFFLLVITNEETSWSNQNLIRSLFQLPPPFSFIFTYSPSFGLSRPEEIYHKAEAASEALVLLLHSLFHSLPLETGEFLLVKEERSVAPCSFQAQQIFSQLGLPKQWHLGSLCQAPTEKLV